MPRPVAGLCVKQLGYRVMCDPDGKFLPIASGARWSTKRRWSACSRFGAEISCERRYKSEFGFKSVAKNRQRGSEFMAPSQRGGVNLLHVGTQKLLLLRYPKRWVCSHSFVYRSFLLTKKYSFGSGFRVLDNVGWWTIYTCTPFLLRYGGLSHALELNPVSLLQFPEEKLRGENVYSVILSASYSRHTIQYTILNPLTTRVGDVLHRHHFHLDNCETWMAHPWWLKGSCYRSLFRVKNKAAAVVVYPWRAQELPSRPLVCQKTYFVIRY